MRIVPGKGYTLVLLLFFSYTGLVYNASMCIIVLTEKCVRIFVECENERSWQSEAEVFVFLQKSRD